MWWYFDIFASWISFRPKWTDLRATCSDMNRDMLGVCLCVILALTNTHTDGGDFCLSFLYLCFVWSVSNYMHSKWYLYIQICKLENEMSKMNAITMIVSNVYKNDCLKDIYTQTFKQDPKYPHSHSYTNTRTTCSLIMSLEMYETSCYCISFTYTHTSNIGRRWHSCAQLNYSIQ